MNPDSLHEDVRFVAAAIRRDRPHDAAAIYFLWAALVLIGFTMADFMPAWVGAYWAAAGPLGGLLSLYLGIRSERNVGIDESADGRRQGWHWGLSGIAGALFGWHLFAAGPASEVGRHAPVFLLIFGLAYALAGIHLNRGLLPAGLAMLVGFLLVAILALPYAWTLTGVICCAALIIGGLRALRG